jgi:hypothetical protein
MTEHRTVRVGDEEIEVERRWEAEFEPSDEWRVEKQKPGSEVTFEDGRLHVDSADERGVTIWTRQEFPGDLLVEYEAICREPDGPTSRNLNCFFCASNDEEPLDSNPRDGGYPDYHDWPNYIFTLTNTHSRLRRDPGFEKVNELMMGVQPDERYRVNILKQGGRIRTCVNGRVIHDWTDPDPYGSGWVGLRTYDTDVTYDEWSVYRPL